MLCLKLVYVTGESTPEKRILKILFYLCDFGMKFDFQDNIVKNTKEGVKMMQIEKRDT